MSRTRTIALGVALLSLGLFAVSLYSLTQRIAEHNRTAARPMFVFKAVADTRFRFADRDVTLTEQERGGQTVIVVQYGDRELSLVRSIPPRQEQLPGFLRHNDWLRVLRLAEYKGGSRETFLEHLNTGADRLVILTRRPGTAADPRTGGVWRRDWVFDFHELLPDGSIDSRTLRYPRTRGDKDPRPDELRPNSWEIDAAMSLMPQSPPDSLNFGRPTTAFKDDALKNAGWTLPVAVASVLALVASLAIAMAPARLGRRG